MTRPFRVRGLAASMGVAIGPARLVSRGRRQDEHAPIAEDALGGELDRFRRAVRASCEEVELAKDELTSLHGSSYAAILDVYLLMHRDPLLIDATIETITAERINAPWALARVIERLKAPLLRDSSIYFRERAQDLDHIEEHLLRHLLGGAIVEPSAPGPCVLFAHDLSPADAVHMLAPPTLGLVTEMGGASSHTAILARTFGVPAVAGTGPLSDPINPGETVVVDGFSGEVIVGPRQEEQEAAARARTRFLDFLRAEKGSPAIARDGVTVSISANIELPGEVDAAIDHGAEGIGLYRTEFMCLGQLGPPSEDEQAEIYARVSSAVAPHRAVFRTFDWRDDKRLRFDRLREKQRLWLRTQIRAVQRANVAGGAALMFPMVATVDEFRTARALVDACAAELGESGSTLPVGMMVEVPSAALHAETFAKHADFFAIGTNDLTQYALGLDRDDPGTAAAASPLHPAVLALIARTLDAADAAGIPCSVCGDMAADPVGLALALGLGCRSVSVPARVIPLARAVVRTLDLGAAAETARRALSCGTVEDVRDLALEDFGPGLTTLWRDRAPG